MPSHPGGPRQVRLHVWQLVEQRAFGPQKLVDVLKFEVEALHVALYIRQSSTAGTYPISFNACGTWCMPSLLIDQLFGWIFREWLEEASANFGFQVLLAQKKTCLSLYGWEVLISSPTCDLLISSFRWNIKLKSKKVFVRNSGNHDLIKGNDLIVCD